MGTSSRRAAVLWLTGLPAAGKTTIASRVHRILAERGVAQQISTSPPAVAALGSSM